MFVEPSVSPLPSPGCSSEFPAHFIEEASDGTLCVDDGCSCPVGVYSVSGLRIGPFPGTFLRPTDSWGSRRDADDVITSRHLFMSATE